MKNNKLLIALSFCGLLLLGLADVQAQSVGTPNGNTAFFNTSFTGNLLGHSETGAFGFFGSGDQWIGIGQPTVSPFISTKVPAYGLRSQWQGQAGIFSLKSASGTTKDLVVEWGADTNSKLKFNFITDLTNPSALTEVMTMTSLGKVGVRNDNPFGTLDVITDTPLGSSTTYGIRSTVTNGNYAVYSGFYNLDIPNSYIAYGLYSNARSNSSFAVYGGYFNGTNNGSIAYGVYATASGTASTKWAGYFLGDVYISGALTVASDKKFKKNIKSLSSSSVTARLMKLNPSSYLYKNTEELPFTEGTQYGFLAQEMEAVFPDLVRDVKQPVFDGVDETGAPKAVEGQSLEFKSINYIGLIPVLTKAFQEQQATISTYKADLAEQKAINAEQKAINAELREKLDRVLSAIELDGDASTIDTPEATETSLGQNKPNPFGQATEITYSLSRSVRDANIQIYNMDGKLLADYKLDKDAKSIQLQANEYQPGVYIYVMMADGETIGTRRMIVSQ